MLIFYYFCTPLSFTCSIVIPALHCHSCERGNPGIKKLVLMKNTEAKIYTWFLVSWIPAFAGMTMECWNDKGVRELQWSAGMTN